MPRCHVSTRKGLFTLERGARGWQVARTSFLGDNVTVMSHDPRDGALYAALNHGHFGVKLHRSRDGGASWQPIASPVYPPKPEGYVPKTPVEGTPADWSLKLVWTLEPGGADEPGVLWCGTLPGGLFRSEDHGETWSLNRPLWDDPQREQWFGGGADHPGIHSVCVDPRDSTPRQDRRLVRWRVDDARRGSDVGARRPPACAPSSCHRSGSSSRTSRTRIAWRSAATARTCSGCSITTASSARTDGGASWSEITGVEPSTFGFAVAAHPDDPQTAWFVPAVKDESALSRSTARWSSRAPATAASTFDVLREGLPQEHAYDLVYRHALDVDPSGTVLAFGSTTGSAVGERRRRRQLANGVGAPAADLCRPL